MTKTQYHGVSRHARRNVFSAHLWVQKAGVQRYLGYFESELDAAIAHDMARIKLGGRVDQEKLNFDARSYTELMRGMHGIDFDTFVGFLRQVWMQVVAMWISTPRQRVTQRVCSRRPRRLSSRPCDATVLSHSCGQDLGCRRYSTFGRMMRVLSTGESTLQHICRYNIVKYLAAVRRKVFTNPTGP